MKGYAALDIGNFGWKAVNSQRELQTPASLVVVNEAEYRRYNPEGMNKEACIIDGKYHILFGKTAKDIQTQPSRGAARYQAEFYDFAVVIMLARIYERSIDDLTVLLTYSPMFSAYTDDMIRLVKRESKSGRGRRKNDGIWKVEYLRQHLEFRIQRAGVKPEPVAALYNLQLTEDFQLANSNVARGAAVIIDIGGHTTDFAFCENGLIDNGSAFAMDAGMFDVEQRFEGYLRESYSEAFRKGSINRTRMHEALATGTFRGGLRGDLEVSDERSRAIAPHLESTMNLFFSYNGLDFDHVILAGGGAAAFLPYIEDRLRSEVIRVRPDGKEMLAEMDKAGEMVTQLAAREPNYIHFAVVYGAFKMLQVLRLKGHFDD